jgi:peptidoglycan hydrolase-like protein with peptidoglycan-binding domain
VYQAHGSGLTSERLSTNGRPSRGSEFALSYPLQSWPVIAESSRYHPIETLQHLLRAHGAEVTVDGVFGPQTVEAVQVFQRDRRLTVSGEVDGRTWSALIVRAVQGSTGDAVRGLQAEFQFRNLSGNPASGVQIDGKFGPQTEAAVIDFQQALGLDIDGVVGPVTWRALVSGMLSF